MRKQQMLLNIMITLLILLFTYTAVSKLADLSEFEKQLRNQVIPIWSVGILLWLLPVTELVVAAMLMSGKYRVSGLSVSVVLMLVFSIYMGLATFHVFDRRPCSCGGVLRSMGFTTHFIFNLTFLFFSIASLRLQKSLDAVLENPKI